MKKLIILATSSFVLILTIGNSVLAETTNLSQSIVPLECFIDAVNAGNGSHLTIRPEDCQEQVIDTGENPPSNIIQKDQETNLQNLIIFSQNNDKNNTIIPSEGRKQPDDRFKNNTTRAFISDNVKNDYFAAFFIITATVTISWASYSYLFLGKSILKKK